MSGKSVAVLTEKDKINMTHFSEHDHSFMRHALRLAEKAGVEGEVPIGAVVAFNNEVIGEGWNAPIRTQDPSAHAEIMALRAAAKNQNNYRLSGATLYVTLEPCMMCASGMIHARIKRLVFGAMDSKAGAAGSQINIFTQPFVNHRVLSEGGLMAEESGRLLKRFFQERRTKS